VEIIGVTDDAYASTFYDSFGNVHTSSPEIAGDVIRWLGNAPAARRSSPTVV
jgi:hypothetical protein